MGKTVQNLFVGNTTYVSKIIFAHLCNDLYIAETT